MGGSVFAVPFIPVQVIGADDCLIIPKLDTRRISQLGLMISDKQRKFQIGSPKNRPLLERTFSNLMVGGDFNLKMIPQFSEIFQLLNFINPSGSKRNENSS